MLIIWQKKTSKNIFKNKVCQENEKTDEKIKNIIKNLAISRAFLYKW
jgi:hypothetical protein